MFKTKKSNSTKNPKEAARKIVAILLNSTNDYYRITAERISSDLERWPDEFAYKNLSEIVNHVVVKDPDDNICNQVYAELCNTTPEEIKKFLQVFTGQIE